jgi:hypothetical protein
MITNNKINAGDNDNNQLVAPIKEASTQQQSLPAPLVLGDI